jgi:serine/threonine-protein phosphatase 2B catalytic subunit
MLLAVLSVCSPEELEDEPSSSEDDAAARAVINEATSPAARAARREQIKNKIRAVGRMQVMFQNLRYVTVCALVDRFYIHVGCVQ